MEMLIFDAWDPELQLKATTRAAKPQGNAQIRHPSFDKKRKGLLCVWNSIAP